MKRKLRTRLSLIKPNMEAVIKAKSEREVCSANKRRGTARVFSVGDRVLVRTVRGELVKWLPGKITEVKSAMTYLVFVDRRIRFVHADHLRRSFLVPDDSAEMSDCHMELPHGSDMPQDERHVEPDRTQSVVDVSAEQMSPRNTQMASSPGPVDTSPPVVPSRRTRATRKPDRLMYEKF